MEPFKISCVTCQAGLSVHDESLLGQILACPRCGSMVEVLPPNRAIEPAGKVEAEQLGSEVAAPPLAAASSSKWIVGVLGCLLGGVTLLGFVLSGDEQPSASANSKVEREASVPVQLETVRPEAAQNVREVEPKEKVEEKIVAATKLKLPPKLSEALADPRPAAQVAQNPAPPVSVAEPQPALLARKFDPLNVDPEDFDLATLEQEATSQPVEPRPEAAVLPEREPQSMKTTNRVVRRSPDTHPPFHGGAVSERLERRLPALQLKSMPLGEFLRFFSHLSGVAVSVGPDQLLMSGITLRQPVSLDVTDVSLEDALERVLTPLKLESIVRGGQLVLLRLEASKVREITYPIADLVDAATTAELLAQWTQQLVAPESWQTSGGSGLLEIKSGALEVTQSQQVHYQLLIFLDRLRMARDLAPKSRFPVKRLTGTSPWWAIQDRLRAKTTFTFSQFTTLDEIFRHWQLELGVPILIDWPALADEQLGPQTRIACAIADSPWSEALDRVLGALGLSWRAVPGKMLEITTASIVENELQLDVFALQGDFDALQRELPPTTLPLGARVHDSASNVLMTLQPAAQQRRCAEYLLERQALLAN